MSTTLFLLTVILTMSLVTMGALDAVRAAILIRCGVRLDAMLSGRVFEALVVRSARQGFPRGRQPLRELDEFRAFITGPGVYFLSMCRGFRSILSPPSSFIRRSAQSRRWAPEVCSGLPCSTSGSPAVRCGAAGTSAKRSFSLHRKHRAPFRRRRGDGHAAGGPTQLVGQPSTAC